jgi:hypothetical protein
MVPTFCLSVLRFELFHTILLHCVKEGKTSLKSVLMITANYTISLPPTGGKRKGITCLKGKFSKGRKKKYLSIL